MSFTLPQTNITESLYKYMVLHKLTLLPYINTKSSLIIYIYIIHVYNTIQNIGTMHIKFYI